MCCHLRSLYCACINHHDYSQDCRSRFLALAPERLNNNNIRLLFQNLRIHFIIRALMKDRSTIRAIHIFGMYEWFPVESARGSTSISLSVRMEWYIGENGLKDKISIYNLEKLSFRLSVCVCLFVIYLLHSVPVWTVPPLHTTKTRLQALTNQIWICKFLLRDTTNQEETK